MIVSVPPAGLDPLQAAIPAAVIAMLVVVPLAYVAWLLTRSARASDRPEQPALILLLVVAVLLAGFTLRSAVMLSLFRGPTGTELLAQQTSSGAVLPTVQRLERLAEHQRPVREPAIGQVALVGLEQRPQLRVLAWVDEGDGRQRGGLDAGHAQLRDGGPERLRHLRLLGELAEVPRHRGRQL